MNLQILPITEDKLLPDHFKQDTWKATVTFNNKNGKQVEAYETATSPEKARAKVLKLIGF